MIIKTEYKAEISEIISQVESLGNVNKRLDLNIPTGDFFSDPWQIKTEFVNTPLGNILQTLGQVGQARLLYLESGETYTAHADPDDRYHLAITTNSYSYLLDLDSKKLHHIPVDGFIYKMDTGITHTASNFGPRTRIHLNVRHLLPSFKNNENALRIKVMYRDYDWKQLAYTPVMSTINKLIKDKTVTGFKKIDDTEIHINTQSFTIFDDILTNLTKNGIEMQWSKI